MVVDYKDMMELLEDNKDLFSVEEICDAVDAARSGELLRCSHCGAFMANGYDVGEDTHYCSERCREEAEGKQEAMLHAYGLEDSPIAELKGRIDDGLLERICVYAGDGPCFEEIQDIIDVKLAQKLNDALARMMG